MYSFIHGLLVFKSSIDMLYPYNHRGYKVIKQQGVLPRKGKQNIYVWKDQGQIGTGELNGERREEENKGGNKWMDN